MPQSLISRELSYSKRKLPKPRIGWDAGDQKAEEKGRSWRPELFPTDAARGPQKLRCFCCRTWGEPERTRVITHSSCLGNRWQMWPGHILHCFLSCNNCGHSWTKKLCSQLFVPQSPIKWTTVFTGLEGHPEAAAGSNADAQAVMHTH